MIEGFLMMARMKCKPQITFPEDPESCPYAIDPNPETVPSLPSARGGLLPTRLL
jgi:hypothetical protein